MKNVLENLRGLGCDVQGALNRMADDEEFYIDCLCDVAKDEYFERLGQALSAGDVTAAFDAAHALKGVLANVGVEPMYEQITEIVEPLRSGTAHGLEEKYTRLIEMRARLRDILAEE